MSGLPPLNNSPENVAIQQNWDNGTQQQKTVNQAGQDVLSKQYAANDSLQKVSQDVQNHVPTSQLLQDENQADSDLKSLHASEQSFWQGKVTEDQSWVNSGGGAAAQSALNSDNNQLQQFSNSDYLQEGSISQIEQSNGFGGSSSAPVSTATSFTQPPATAPVTPASTASTAPVSTATSFTQGPATPPATPASTASTAAVSTATSFNQIPTASQLQAQGYTASQASAIVTLVQGGMALTDAEHLAVNMGV